MADHQYGLPNHGHLATGSTPFPMSQKAPEPYFFHRNLASSSGNNNEAIMLADEMVLPGGLVWFGHRDNFAAAAATYPSETYRVDMESSGWGNIGINEGGNCRWPRQETLTLLEIRSRLDSKFKETNQKKPLWDEVSRRMAEEHGYHRSEKKCREKFENLYKYYKKTKEVKAGRQDGKHYRFFRQLEALYGETSNNQNSISESHLDRNTNFVNRTPNLENQETFQEHKIIDQSLSFSNTCEFETASSENNDDDLSASAFMMKQKYSMEKHSNMNGRKSGKRVKRNWKGKVKEFVDAQMKDLMESQETWMERMLKTIEDREEERVSKEEDWRKQEMARLGLAHEFWARKRAWIEAQDKALMEALKKVTGRDLEVSSSSSSRINGNKWNEPETSSLIQLVTSLEQEFEQSGYSDDRFWEEIAAKMARFGYYRSAIDYKEKWEHKQMYFKNKTSSSSHQDGEYYHHHGHDQIAKQRFESMELLPYNNTYARSIQSHECSCFHVLITEDQQQFMRTEEGKE